MGVPSIPPYFESNDERTINTFESVKFKELIYLLTHESTLRVDDSKSGVFKDGLQQLLADAGFSNNDVVVLKTPLASLCLRHISRAVDTSVIMVHRPLEEIEATRKRRNWQAVYGAAGAQVIYSRLLSDVIELNMSFLGVSYPALLANPGAELQKILQFSQLECDEKQLQQAVDFIWK